MDRRTAIVLVAAVILMIGAGVAMLLLVRKIDLGTDRGEPPEDLAAAYMKEVESRCNDGVPRPVVGGGEGTEGAAAGFYVQAIELLPDLDETTWAQIMDDTLVESWNGDSPELPAAVAEFGPAVGNVLDGAGRPDGRSPYAFCAIDTDADLLDQYRRLARAMELVAKSKVEAGDEKTTAAIIASLVQMELDLGRSGGILLHAIATMLVKETVLHAIAPYAGVASDPEALRILMADLAMIERSWIDLGDNARVEGLVEETLYASCFMPPGWDPPVGPPVMSRQEQESVCALGPSMTRTMWQVAHESNMKIVEALDAPGPASRYERLLEMEEASEETPMWVKLIKPERLLADLASPDISPRVLDDAEHLTYLNLARAMLSLRLLMMEAGSLPSHMDETSWKGLEDDGKPYQDPYTGLRPVYTLRDGDTVIMRSPAQFPDRLSPAIATRLAPIAQPAAQPRPTP